MTVLLQAIILRVKSGAVRKPMYVFGKRRAYILPTYVYALKHAYVHRSVQARLHTYMPSLIHAVILECVRTCMQTCMLAYMYTCAHVQTQVHAFWDETSARMFLHSSPINSMLLIIINNGTVFV